MSDAQWLQYQNLQIFAKKWRNYTPETQPRDKDTFRNDMQFSEYVDLKYRDNKTRNPVIIYLFSPDSKYAKNSPELRKLFYKIKRPTKVILVTKDPLKTFSQNVIRDMAFAHLDVSVYRHETFNIVVPEGPLCYPHRVISPEEVRRLLNNDLFCYLINPSKIRVDDPQCIWIGAEVGDIVEITSLSDIALRSIHYRLVIEKSGNVTSMAAYKKRKDESAAEPEMDEVHDMRADIREDDQNEQDDED